MSKLDQKIQEINGKILALASKKSKLLAIKGGAGSGRYPAGSSGNSGGGESSTTTSGERMVAGRSVSERVGMLRGMEKPQQKIDTDNSSESDTKELLASRAVSVSGTVQNYDSDESVDSSQLTTNTAVNQIQETFGMHPADLRSVILSGVRASGERGDGIKFERNPVNEIDFDVQNDGVGNTEIRVTMDNSNVKTDLTFLLDGRSNAVNPISMRGIARVPIRADGSTDDKANRAMNEKLTSNIRQLARAVGAEVNSLTIN